VLLSNYAFFVYFRIIDGGGDGDGRTHQS
jgi:hypothetical protein